MGSRFRVQGVGWRVEGSGFREGRREGEREGEREGGRKS